jgi:hypothetical protein
MISFLLGLAAVAGGGFLLYTLTKGMPQDTVLKYAGSAILLVIGGSLLG